jgi:hypothetical protein
MRRNRALMIALLTGFLVVLLALGFAFLQPSVAPVPTAGSYRLIDHASFVMPALDAGIQGRSSESVALDCRVTPGNDVEWVVVGATRAQAFSRL